MEGVNGEEDQAGVTQKQVKDDQDNEEDLDPEEYNKKTNEFFGGIIKKMNEVAEYVNKIEKAMVTNITNDLSIVKALVVEFCTQNYMKSHVKGKVKCIDKEVDEVIKHLKSKREKKKKKKTKEEEEEEERKLVKTSEWLNYIGQKTEKIKNLVSQFGSLPDEDDGYEEESSASSSSLTGGGKREKQKTVSNSTECHKMCIEESLLISPMMAASLKKSYDHLPSNELKLCLLTLSAFPEDFIIKKRPLIYWWMAEGFVVVSNSSSAEEVGEQNFTQLIQHGLIQPWYESGNTTTTTDQPHNNNVVHVQGCRVHPWIRRMLVSIAMDAQLFEFFGIPQENSHPHPPGNNNPPPPPRSRRACLYDDGEGVDLIATWKTRTRKYDKFRERLKWIKRNAVLWENIKKALHEVKEESFEITMPIEDRLKEVSDRQRKLLITYTRFLAAVNTLVGEVVNTLVGEVVTHGKIMKPAAVPWSDDHDSLLNALNHRLSNVKTQIDDAMKNNNDASGGDLIKKLQDEQMKVVNDIESLEKVAKDQMNYLERVLVLADTDEVYQRSNICDILQKNELLFTHNDLTKPFPFPMKKDKRILGKSNANQKEQDKKSDEEAVAAAAERLLAIINVTQKYLDMDHEAFGKMKRLRTLHLGRWRDSLPVPHIEVEDARILEALFHVAKHLKYLSLRGISRITELPSNISNCCNLQILDLKACYNLEKLPAQIAFLYKLTHLDVSECYLLQNNNLWSLVQPLQFLQTLKGLKVDQSTQTSLKALATAGSLRKLSIILTERDFNIDLLTGLSKLCILTITWRITPDPQQKPGASTENPRQEQPEKTDNGGGASTENPPPQQPEKSDDGGGGSTENPPPQQPEKSDGGGGGSTENPPQQQTDIEEALPNHLKKLDLRCYPDKDWPNWAKKHSSLETLYITGGDLEEFPMADLNLPKLQLLRFKYLTKLKLGEDFNTPHLKSTIFPSLITFINHSIKSKK